MAKVTIKTEPTYLVQLSHAEAKYIKDVLQNPPCHPDDEDPNHAILRNDLWVALGEVMAEDY